MRECRNRSTGRNNRRCEALGASQPQRFECQLSTEGFHAPVSQATQSYGMKPDEASRVDSQPLASPISSSYVFQVMNNNTWPSLVLGEWQDTLATLHMWTQIVGK